MKLNYKDTYNKYQVLSFSFFFVLILSLVFFDLQFPTSVRGASTTAGDLKIKRGDIIIPNNHFYRAKANGGAERRVFGLTTSNNLIIGGTNLGNIRFDAGNSKGGLFIQKGTGNVGLGTTSPQARFHVNNGDVLINNNRFYRAKASGGANRRVFGLNPSNDLIIGGTNLGSIRFDAGNSKAGLLVEQGSGYMGIGTSNPSSDVHIQRNGSATLTVEADRSNSSENNQAKIELKQDGGATVGKMGYYDSSDNLKIENSSGGSKILLKDNGDICIGNCN